jgi:hypothetical protein
LEEADERVDERGNHLHGDRQAQPDAPPAFGLNTEKCQGDRDLDAGDGPAPEQVGEDV